MLFDLLYDKSNLKKLEDLTDQLEITELQKKETERKLIKSSKEWRDTFDSIQDLIFIQDNDYNIIKVNRAFAARFNMEPRDLIGKKCYDYACVDVYNSSIRPPSECPFGCILEGKKPVVRQAYSKVLGGWVEISIFPVNNGVTGAIHVIRDINERKIAEIELAKKTKIIEMMSNQVTDCLWAKDESNRFTYANRTHLDMILKRSLEEVIGLTDTEVANMRRSQLGVVHDFGELCNKTDDITKQSKITCHFVEVAKIDNDDVWLDVYKTPIMINGIVKGTVGCARDITTRAIETDLLNRLFELDKQGKVKHLFDRTFQLFNGAQV